MNHRKSILNYIFFLTLLISFSSFTVGCLSDENKTLELDSNNSITTDVSKVIDHQYHESKQPMKAEFIDSKINDLLQAQAKLIVPEIEKAFPKQYLSTTVDSKMLLQSFYLIVDPKKI